MAQHLERMPGAQVEAAYYLAAERRTARANRLIVPCALPDTKFYMVFVSEPIGFYAGEHDI